MAMLAARAAAARFPCLSPLSKTVWVAVLPVYVLFAKNHSRMFLGQTWGRSPALSYLFLSCLSPLFWPFFKSTLPSDKKGTPSASSRAACSAYPGAVSPLALTTRWHGVVGSLQCASACPTCLAALGERRYAKRSLHRLPPVRTGFASQPHTLSEKMNAASLCISDPFDYASMRRIVPV